MAGIDLVGSIVDWFTNGTGSAHDALVALTSGPGAMIGDFDYENVPAPYIIVSDKLATRISQGTANSYRLESHTIHFECWAYTRGLAVELTEAVLAAYLDQTLTVTGYTVLARPLLDMPAMVAYISPDMYSGTIGLEFIIEKDSF